MRGRPRYHDILTPREWQVLDLLREGLTNDEIAERLGISRDGAKYHVSEIIAKLGVNNRYEAAAIAPKRRLVGFIPVLALPFSGLKSAAVTVTGASFAIAGLVALIVVLFAAGGDSKVGDLGRLAYIQDGNLWVKQMPDGAPLQLTDAGAAHYPSWSTDGEWLTASLGGNASTAGTWLFSADGSEQRRLSATFFPTWSPIDSRLAYVNEAGRLMVDDPSTGTQTELAAPSAEGEVLRDAVWSPDASLVGFVATDDESYQSVRLVDADGTNPREVHRFDSSAGRVLTGGWRQDGSEVLIWSFGESATPNMKLWALPLSGGPPRDLRLTEIGYDAYVELAGGERPFVVQQARGLYMNRRLIVLDDFSGNALTLEMHQTFALEPAWSPDGAWLAYVASEDESWSDDLRPVSERRLWLMRADGTDQRRLTRDAERPEEWPVWSNDGRRLLMVRPEYDSASVDVGASLWLVDVSSGARQRITQRLDAGPNSSWPAPPREMSSINWAQLFDWWQTGR